MSTFSRAPRFNVTGFKYAAGSYVSPMGAIAAATAHTVGTVRVVPIHITYKQTITHFKHGITVTGGAGSLVDCVLYDTNMTTGLPGTLVASSVGNDGTVVSATGADSSALSVAQTLDPGVYWIGSLSRVGAATQLSITPSSFRGPQATTWAAVAEENIATVVAATVPTTFGTVVWVSGIAPRVGLKISA